MAKKTWYDAIKSINKLLSSLLVTNDSGNVMSADEGFLRLKEITLKIKRNRRSVFLIGNGASASMASHMAADLAKNAKLHTEVFSDLSLITAISNDMGFENVFSEPLSRRCCRGDMLVAISSSGESVNVLKAVKLAKSKGLKIVTFSAMSECNTLRKQGIINFYVPAMTYGNAESCHAVLLHYWMDLLVGVSLGSIKTKNKLR